MMDANIQKIAKGEKVPQFDLPVDLIVYDDINSDLLRSLVILSMLSV